MILQNNENPLDSLYYIGYQFILWIKKSPKKSFDIDNLYNDFNIILQNKITYNKFLLLLDWLHLNNCLEIGKEGTVYIDVFN
jgi:hypothetical protein